MKDLEMRGAEQKVWRGRRGEKSVGRMVSKAVRGAKLLAFELRIHPIAEPEGAKSGA